MERIVLREVEGVGPVEILDIDPQRNIVTYRTIMPVLTHMPDGTNEVCVTGFDFCLN